MWRSLPGHNGPRARQSPNGLASLPLDARALPTTGGLSLSLWQRRTRRVLAVLTVVLVARALRSSTLGKRQSIGRASHANSNQFDQMPSLLVRCREFAGEYQGHLRRTLARSSLPRFNNLVQLVRRWVLVAGRCCRRGYGTPRTATPFLGSRPKRLIAGRGKYRPMATVAGGRSQRT